MTLREALMQISTLDARDLDIDVAVHPLGGVMITAIVTLHGFAWASAPLSVSDLALRFDEFVPRVTTPITAGVLQAVQQQTADVIALTTPAQPERHH